MALMETLVDNFDDNSISATWGLSGPGTPSNQIKEQNNQLELSSDGVNGDYFTFQSVSTYDLTGSSAKIQLVSAGSQAANFDCIPLLLVDGGGTNKLWWDVSGGTLTAFKTVSGSQTSVGSTTYSSSTHKFLRIRESGGTTYWDYSTDGRAWFNLVNASNPITVTALAGAVQVGQFGAAASSTLKVDNFNYRTQIFLPSNKLRPHPFSPGIAR